MELQNNDELTFVLCAYRQSNYLEECIESLVSQTMNCKIIISTRVISVGDPISCPTVSYNLDLLEQPIFRNRFKSCEDWEAWESISKMKGDFVYIPKPLMSHRIHEESTTTEVIQANVRVEENYKMLCKFWPKVIAKGINHFYTKAEKSNEL